MSIPKNLAAKIGEMEGYPPNPIAILGRCLMTSMIDFKNDTPK